MTGRLTALLARLIRVPVVPDGTVLLGATGAGAVLFEPDPLDGLLCRTYWGSHGCDLPPGPHPTHVCGSHDPDGPCSRARLADDGTAWVAWEDSDDWHVWGSGLFGEDVPA